MGRVNDRNHPECLGYKQEKKPMTMTLTELRDAYAAGTITTPMLLDNDSVSVGVEFGKEIFISDPYQLLRDALDLLGIPHENV